MKLKSKTLSYLNSIEDEETLKEIYDRPEAFIEADTMKTFKSYEIQAVEEGYEQYLAGKTIPRKEDSTRLDQWLAQKGK